MYTLRRTPSGAGLLCAIALTLTVSACADGTDQPTTPQLAPQMAKGGSTSGDLTVSVTLAGKGNNPAYPVTVGLVGPAPAGPLARMQTDASGVVTFADVPNGQYCVWASPVALAAFNAGGKFVVPTTSYIPDANGLDNQGAVLASGSNKQEPVTDASYDQYCRDESTRPIVINGNTSVKLQLVSYPSSTIELYGFDGNAVNENSIAYLIGPFTEAWPRSGTLSLPYIETLMPGFLLGSAGGLAQRKLPAPSFLYYIEALSLVPTLDPSYDIPSAKGLTGAGQQDFGVVYMEPLSCEVKTIFDPAGDAGNPDIQGSVYFGYGADPSEIHPVADRFGVWWEQAQTGTVSMQYNSRTYVDGFPTLQLSVDFTLVRNGSSCSVQPNPTVSGSATSAGMTAYVYCLVSALSGRVRVTVVEKGLPTGYYGHTFQIGAQGNSPGPAESVPSAEKSGSSSSYVDGGIAPANGECEDTANDPKFDINN